MKKVLLFLIGGMASLASLAQADLAITAMTASPSTLAVGGTGVITITAGNGGQDDVFASSARVQLTISANCTITGIHAGSDPRWTQFSLTAGPANTIQLRNIGGSFVAFAGDAFGDILLDFTAVVNGGPSTFTSNISYIPANPGAAQGDVPPTNNSGTTQLTVTTLVALGNDVVATAAGDCLARVTWRSYNSDLGARFITEYSPDGINFTKVAEVNGKYPNGGKYETAYNQGAGAGYYRIKTVLINGETEYTSVARTTVNCNVKKVFIYPNPVQQGQVLNVNVTGYANGIKGELSTIGGQVVVVRDLQNGLNKIQMLKLPEGTYNFKVTDDNGGSQNYKVVVVK